VPITKEQLIEESTQLLEELRSEQRNSAVLLFSPATSGRMDSYIHGCIDFQMQVLKVDETDQSKLLELYRDLIILERTTRRRVLFLNIIPAVLLLYVVFVLAFVVLTSFDIEAFLKNNFSVETPIKYISLGISGALLYLITSYISARESSNLGGDKFSSLLDVTLRFVLAIFVPVILVILIFNPDGTHKEIFISPELLSFACGYSAKLVIDLLSKLVEKAQNMVKAL
jgi:hypothetical protein